MRLIFLFVAIALAAAAFVVTLNLTQKSEPAPVPVAAPAAPQVKEVPTVNVYVARQDIPIGTGVTRAMVDIQPWPKHLLLPDFVTQDQDIFGEEPKDGGAVRRSMVARTPFQKGEVIMRGKLANPNDPSFIASSLPKNMRAVTIQADPISGVAGFVFPGDRVDVLITHNVELVPSQINDQGVSVPAVTDPVTEVLLPNIKVLAVNQRSTMQGTESPQPPSSFTLEVSQQQAQKLRLTELAQAKLSVTLRSIEDKDDFELTRPTGKGDLSRITPPSYFPVLYDQKSSYTPTIISGEGSVLQKGTGNVIPRQNATPKQTPLANLVKDGINQTLPDQASSNKKIIAVVRGVKMEPVEVRDQ